MKTIQKLNHYNYLNTLDSSITHDFTANVNKWHQDKNGNRRVLLTDIACNSQPMKDYYWLMASSIKHTILKTGDHISFTASLKYSDKYNPNSKRHYIPKLTRIRNIKHLNAVECSNLKHAHMGFKQPKKQDGVSFAEDGSMIF